MDSFECKAKQQRQPQKVAMQCGVLLFFVFLNPWFSQKSFSYQSIEKQHILQKYNSCLYQRGMSGHWVQDWEYANRTDYRNHGSYSDWHLADQNFTSTKSQPFRLATSYRWVDDSNCPIHEVDLQEFCNACLSLQINQILIMGDSLSIEFTQALQSLLGFPPIGRRATGFNARFQPWTMKCPASNHLITFLMVRLSQITDWENLAKQAREQQNITVVGRAQEFINSSNNKTAIIANLGSWMQTTREYKLGFMSFLEWLSYLEPNKVVTFWRPTIPGHFDCLPATSEEKTSFDWKHPVVQEPYKNYSEYYQIMDERNQTKQLTGLDTHRWELFESWNTWTYEKLHGVHYQLDHDDNINKDSSNLNDSAKNGQKVYWLNIFNSSVLRRDGHVGFGDCLHYYLPGPPDWWAHFFHSALLDLAHTNT
mmetsp:Transcript_10717/g.14377  ORF Transcript_10717/g.14377 Transcript_10717/m.14377 type:complete len:423 (+) Transcript_10717:32-1300(+)